MERCFIPVIMITVGVCFETNTTWQLTHIRMLTAMAHFEFYVRYFKQHFPSDI